jgi:mannose-6-phosphate isomerase class I
LVRLKGAIQHYAWGGVEFIPSLLGMENPDCKPFAELWIGAHPNAPAMVETESGWVPLDRWLRDEDTLDPARDPAGRPLPYLLKILDAREMLSIQAHPTKRHAEEGFARENAAGVPLGAATRNYKDDNHKPEVHVALTEFWMLHGFRPIPEIAQVLASTPEFAPVWSEFHERFANARPAQDEQRSLLRELYGWLMRLPQDEVDAILDPLIARIQSQPDPSKDSPDTWAIRAAECFPLPGGHRDRGIFSIYLLNLVHLHPGEGTYQPAGVLHAYLQGTNVELMANSDNVLRGGLTQKHVDVEELIRTLTFDCGTPTILHRVPASETERVYPTPASEFELSEIELLPDRRHSGVAYKGPTSLIVLGGSGSMTSGADSLSVKRGDIVLAPSGTSYLIAAGKDGLVVFKAAEPEDGASLTEWD